MADRWDDLDRYMAEWTETERRRLEREREGRLAAYEEMTALIERSSFGTPGAKAIRARTPPEVVAEITRRVHRTVERHYYQEAGGQTPGECRLCDNVPTATCHQVLG